MSVLDKLKGLLQSPTAQGIGMAAATGFNPLIGLLAAPGIKSGRERREIEMDERRERIRAARSQNNARDDLRGLLTQNTTVQGAPRSVGLLDPEGGMDAISIPSRRESVPTVNTPAGQQQLMGLLGELAPGAVAQSVLPSNRADSATIREMQALGYPLTQEGFQAFQDAKGGGTQEIEALLTRLELENAITERDQTRQERTRARQTEERGINRNLRKIGDLAELSQNLQGTFLETGLPFSEFRRGIAGGKAGLQKLIGMDAEKTEEMLADYDKLNKGLSDLIIETQDRFGGTLTNDKLALLENASANPEISPEAAAAIFADIAEIHLDQADINEYSIEDRREVEKLILDLRNFKRNKDDAGEPKIDYRYNPNTGRLEPVQ